MGRFETSFLLPHLHFSSFVSRPKLHLATLYLTLALQSSTRYSVPCLANRCFSRTEIFDVILDSSSSGATKAGNRGTRTISLRKTTDITCGLPGLAFVRWPNRLAATAKLLHKAGGY